MIDKRQKVRRASGELAEETPISPGLVPDNLDEGDNRG